MNSGFFGLGLLAYASWQTLHFLGNKTSHVWARPRYHRYLPRPTTETLKKGKSCEQCLWFRHHPDFNRSGECAHTSWKMVMRSDEVLVRKAAHCDLFEGASS